MMRLSVLGIACFLSGANTGVVAAASFSKAARGTTGAQFLELPVGARAVGMGSAQGAAARGATALYYNPAALAAIEGGDAAFMHAAHFEGISFDYLAVARSWGRFGTFGLGAQYLTPGSLNEVDNTGTATGGSFTPRDLALSVGHGRAWGSLELGWAAKYVSSKIQASANTFAADAGTRWRTGPWALSFGVANVGPGLKFREKADPLPATVRLGSSYARGRWLFSLDALAPRGTAPYPALGAEYRRPLSEKFAVAGRFGYDGRLRESRLGGMAGLAFGGGLEYGRLSFDYAMALYGDLGPTHRMSLGFSWGARSGAAKARERTDFGRALAKAELLVAKGRLGEARSVLERAEASLAPNDGRRLLYYEASGNILRAQDDCPGARGRYLAGLAMAGGAGMTAPGLAGCYVGMGLCLVQEKKDAEAAAYLRKGLEANPDPETLRAIEEGLGRLRGRAEAGQ